MAIANSDTSISSKSRSRQLSQLDPTNVQQHLIQLCLQDKLRSTQKTGGV